MSNDMSQNHQEWLETVPIHLVPFVQPAMSAWNAKADSYNQWGDLDWHERNLLVRQQAFMATYKEGDACPAGNHIVGTIANRPIRFHDWEAEITRFDAVVTDFNIRGQREQINHPGFVTRCNYCPECGAFVREIPVRDWLAITPKSV